jgi:Protein of unknown function (DUF2695)
MRARLYAGCGSAPRWSSPSGSRRNCFRCNYIMQCSIADTVWFELTPGETPNEVEEDPDEELIVSITPDVLGSLLQSGFFAALDNLLCSINNTTPPEVCYGDFRYAKRTLQDCGFQESDWSDVFHVLMGQGAFCDCEILYNAATESRLRSKYWQRHSHQIRS